VTRQVHVGRSLSSVVGDAPGAASPRLAALFMYGMVILDHQGADADG
jgi:hypothetical protein